MVRRCEYLWWRAIDLDSTPELAISILSLIFAVRIKSFKKNQIKRAPYFCEKTKQNFTELTR